MTLDVRTGSMPVASWLELSESAARANVSAFRSLLGSTRLGAVLKGNAYGHGLTHSLQLFHGAVDRLYVITVDEALRIRAWERASGRPAIPLLVIGAVDAADCVELAREGVEVVASDRGLGDAARGLEAAGLTLQVHVHLDTGLGREGFTPAGLAKGELQFLADHRRVLSVRGVLSHFANTEDVTEQSYARAQLSAFEAGLQRVREVAGGGPLERHIAASAAAVVLPPSRFDIARVGVSLYGLWPSTETRISARVVAGQVPALEPVLSWRAPSQAIKWLSAGSYVGYGCTWRCATDTRVAVLPVGYWDGYPRLASGKAHVLVNGQRCAVLGRVMMNHLIVDVTHATSDERPVVATLLGRDGEESVSAETISGWAQTIHYETVTRLGAHLERRLVR